MRNPLNFNSFKFGITFLSLLIPAFSSTPVKFGVGLDFSNSIDFYIFGGSFFPSTKSIQLPILLDNKIKITPELGFSYTKTKNRYTGGSNSTDGEAVAVVTGISLQFGGHYNGLNFYAGPKFKYANYYEESETNSSDLYYTSSGTSSNESTLIQGGVALNLEYMISKNFAIAGGIAPLVSRAKTRNQGNSYSPESTTDIQFILDQSVTMNWYF